MKTFKFQKLVRDKIVEEIEEKKERSVSWRKLDDAEFARALKNKILEEAAELDFEKTQEIAGELADLEEIITYLLNIYHIQPSELKRIQEDKRRQNGGFDKRTYIETVDLPDDDEWLGYYRKKYEEIKKK